MVGIFVTTKTESELRERLVARGQGSEADRRLRIRTDQLTWAWMYDYVLVNNTRDEACTEVSVQVLMVQSVSTQRQRRLCHTSLQGRPKHARSRISTDIRS